MTSEPTTPPSPEPSTPSIESPDVWRQANSKLILIGTARNFRGFILPLGFLIITQGMNQSRENIIWYGLAVGAALISVVASVLQWWFYRYRISDSEITLRTGFISKQERVIPFERIQTIDIQDAPLERMLGVVQMRIDTGAGGGESEIALQALSGSEALTLRTQLLAARQRLRGGDSVAEAGIDPLSSLAASEHLSPEDAIAEAGVLIRTLSRRELLIAGATSGRIGAAAALIGLLVQFGEQLIPRRVWERLPWDGIADSIRQVDVVAGLVVTLGVIAWLISIISTVLVYGNFEIRRLGDHLQIRHGLLDRRQTSIPIRRIQAVRVVEGLLRQPFGFAEIRFDSAGFGADAGASGVLIPLIPRTSVYDFLLAACPDFAQQLQPAELRRLPRRAMRRYVVAATIGWVIFVGIVAGVVWRFTSFSPELVLTALVITPVFGWLGYRRYLDAGWQVHEGSLFLRWRGVARVTVFTQVRRLQYRQTTTDPFQRRARLATFRTAVASGGSLEGFSVPHLDTEDADLLLQELGTSRRNRS